MTIYIIFQILGSIPHTGKQRFYGMNVPRKEGHHAPSNWISSSEVAHNSSCARGPNELSEGGPFKKKK